MTDEENLSPIDGDNLDLDSLRELSEADYQDDIKSGEIAAPKVASAKVSKAKVADDDDEARDDEAYEKEDKTLEQPDEEDSDAEEDSDSEADGEDDKKINTEEDEEADDAESGDDGDVDKESDSQADPSLTFIAVDGNGKSVAIPKEALIKIPVDGVEVEMTVQEAINKASGATNIERGNSELGRERAAFKAERAAYEADVAQANENAEFLYELAQSGNPEDFVQHFAMIKGVDPTQVMRNLVENTLKYAEQFAGMTPGEIKLHNENLQLKHLENVRSRRDSLAVAQAEAQAQQQRMEAEADVRLKAEGMTWDDFEGAVKSIRQIAAERGVSTGNVQVADIVQHATVLRHDAKLRKAIAVVDKTVLHNSQKLGEISRALWQDETLHLKRRMSDEEAVEFVQKALGKKSAKSLGESLSRKVERADKSGKTNSQTASSQRRKNNGYHDTLTLAEHRERMEQLEAED